MLTGERERELEDMVAALDRIVRLHDDLTFRERAQLKAAADFLSDLRREGGVR